jgi:hypothetical protein
MGAWMPNAGTYRHPLLVILLRWVAFVLLLSLLVVGWCAGAAAVELEVSLNVGKKAKAVTGSFDTDSPRLAT